MGDDWEQLAFVVAKFAFRLLFGVFILAFTILAAVLKAVFSRPGLVVILLIVSVLGLMGFTGFNLFMAEQHYRTATSAIATGQVEAARSELYQVQDNWNRIRFLDFVLHDGYDYRNSDTLLKQIEPTPSPTPTPAPTFISQPTAQPSVPSIVSPLSAPDPTAPACTNDSKFEFDMTIPDGTHLAPNAAFIKVWRIRNTGTCPWTTAYEYRFAGGYQMAGNNINIPDVVAPGETIDLSITLVAPTSAGHYRGHWRLVAPDGVAFGQMPYVDIVVQVSSH